MDLIERQKAIDALHMHLMYRMGTDSNKKRLDDWINSLPSAQPDHSGDVTEMVDLIERQAAIDAPFKKFDMATGVTWIPLEYIEKLQSAQPEQPPYVAEIEAEYQKAVKMPHIHKPLAKALYEVWKKHDREDAERRADEDR